MPRAPLVRNFLFLGAGEFASKVFGFLAFAYLARVLGPREFGQIEFALALIVFLYLARRLWSWSLWRPGNRKG